MERPEPPPSPGDATRTHLPPAEPPTDPARSPHSTIDHAPTSEAVRPGPDRSTGTAVPPFVTLLTDAAAVAARVGRSGPFPVVPGYEIEGELGRGGMGVVYLARQLSLKRLVALKIVKAGADASPEQLARFRAEAEAVAQLQHPNVVQVYEIGDYDGCPFCSLEYVPGGSLAAHTRRKPQPPADAAALVETLARAVHHAHQKGIIHRDLKPANILLAKDESGRMKDEPKTRTEPPPDSSFSLHLSSFQPKVTDFGLAKRLQDADSARTRPGAVMGTPAYMAPEQAAGRVSEIGPRTDVYALGAILYELLTGRPPFQGESGDAVVLAVLTADLTPPSAVLPGIPRDLETVCLKCLEREPDRRYSSALALAQDLERFRSGEPILARRLGLLGKAWRKVRKRALPLGLAVGLLVAFGVAAEAVRQRGTARQAAAMDREINEQLDAPDWTPEYRDRLEERVGGLGKLDLAMGVAARQRLLDRSAKRLRDVIGKQRLAPGDVVLIEAELRWLAERDPALAAVITGEYRGRDRKWLTPINLGPPFAGVDDIFPPGVVRVEARGLVPVKAWGIVPPIPTTVPSVGSVKYDAEFGLGWERTTEFGLALDVPLLDPRPEAGYTVVLIATPRTAEGGPSGPPSPNAPRPNFRATEYNATLVVRHGTLVLRAVEVQLTPGPVRLFVERDGDRLRARVNDLPPAEHQEIVPPRSGDGVFGVAWPPGVPLARLRAENMALPPAPSALERADDLYSRGRFADALPLYEGQAANPDPVVAAEAGCKTGLCLLELNRPEDAARVLEPIIAGVGDRWPAVAGVYLWVSRLRQNRFEDAEAVLTNLAVRFPRKKLASLVPESVRSEILTRYHLPTLSYFKPSHDTVRQLQARLRLTEILQSDAQNAHVRYLLGAAHALVGDEEQAIAEFRRLVLQPLDKDILREVVHDLAWAARWYGWAMQQRGNPCGARGELDEAIRKMFSLIHGNPTVLNSWGVAHAHAFRIPHARAAAVCGDWSAAESALDRLLADPAFTKSARYAMLSEAWLMKGFLRDRAGDSDGAQAAWRNGTYRAYRLTRNPDDKSAVMIPKSGYDLYAALLAGSLSGDLTDEEATTLFQNAAAAATDDPVFAQIAGNVTISPAVIRGLFRSERGKEQARRMAFLDMAPPDYYTLRG